VGGICNTKRIAQLFSSLSGEQLVPRGHDGPPVRLVQCAPEDVVSRADDAVEALLDEGWEAGHIALLTTHHRHPEQKQAVDVGGYAAYWDAFFAEEDVFYGHVLGFKGLERSVVVLAVNGFKDVERAKEMLYVGLSRARTLLVVVGQRELLTRTGGAGVANRLRSAERWTP
jgi:DNA helicase IV